MKDQFLLDPEIIYLNHGSFGACPKPIFKTYQYWQQELEREPVQFLLKKGPIQLVLAKTALANYINSEPEDFFFVPNPTHAINTVMRSLKLKAGDEILATDHEYGAMDRTWNFYSKQSGIVYVRQKISLPIKSREQIIDEFWSGLTNRTKVVFLNQISSATSLIFPVEEIIKKARRLGLITIIDGAHVPGHIALDIKKLDPDYYTGTLHKWMLAPKGSSFLYVKREFQDGLDPLVVSWGYESVSLDGNRFLDYHEQQGTRDISRFLCTDVVVDFLNKNNWQEKSKTCRELILKNYPLFCRLLNTEPICPITPEFLGQMCSIPIQTDNPGELKELLFSKFNIEIPVMPLNGKHYLRISMQAYNSQGDLDALYAALQDILATTNLLNIA